MRSVCSSTWRYCELPTTKLGGLGSQRDLDWKRFLHPAYIRPLYDRRNCWKRWGVLLRWAMPISYSRKMPYVLTDPAETAPKTKRVQRSARRDHEMVSRRRRQGWSMVSDDPRGRLTEAADETALDAGQMGDATRGSQDAVRKHFGSLDSKRRNGPDRCGVPSLIGIWVCWVGGVTG